MRSREIQPVATVNVTIGANDYEISPHGREIRIYLKKGSGWRKVHGRKEIRDVLIAAKLLKGRSDEV